jgi:integrase
MVLLASWCAMRVGELAELRRGDIDVKNGIIHIRRAVTRADGVTIVSTPKSDAGTRDVAIPPHRMPLAKEHLRNNITPEPVTGCCSRPPTARATWTLYKSWSFGPGVVVVSSCRPSRATNTRCGSLIQNCPRGIGNR